MSITVEYHGGKWMVRGVCNSTNKQQLMDRMRAIQPAKNKQAGNQRGDQASLREIQQLRQQLRDALQENERTSQRLQQMEGVNRRLTTTVNQQQTQLEGNQAELQEKDESLHQKTKPSNKKMPISKEKMQKSNRKAKLFNNQPSKYEAWKTPLQWKTTSLNETTQQYLNNNRR